MRIRLLIALLSLLSGLAAWAEPAASRPNILLILSDDHAKNAIGCYGNTDIKTPHLDRLAREGMRFEHALTPNSFCTPARAADQRRSARHARREGASASRAAVHVPPPPLTYGTPHAHTLAHEQRPSAGDRSRLRHAHHAHP